MNNKEPFFTHHLQQPAINPFPSPLESELELRAIDNSGQLPDMREILINSLKINKKLHGEIIAKQYSVKNETQQVNLKLQALYRDMEEIYKKTQHLYEETVRQNQKTRFMAQELLKPFREELKGKVDETTLSLKMKMMLSEFDSLGHKISYDNDGNVVTTDDNHTFKFIRTEVLPLISSIEHQLHENSIVTKQQAQGLGQLKGNQDELTRDMIKIRENMFEMQTTLLDEINSKTNDETWELRLSNFYNSFVGGKINAVVGAVDRQQRQMNGGMIALKEEVSCIEKGLKTLTAKSQGFNVDVNKRMEGLRQELMKITKINVSQSLVEIRKSIQEKNTALKRQVSQLQKDRTSLMLEENKKLKEKIQSFTTQLHSEVQKAMQSFDKGLIFKVSKLDSQLKSTTQHIKTAQKMLQSNQFEIGFIKDLLSKKANFSDVIVHVENKADKQDYKELKHLLESNTNLHVESLQEDNCMLTQEEPKTETATSKFRKRQNPASRRNYQQSSSPFVDSQRDDSVKRYMLGLKNGTTNYTRDSILKQKSKFLFLHQSERRKPKQGGEAFTENFI